jgi:hypothetical protein
VISESNTSGSHNIQFDFAPGALGVKDLSDAKVTLTLNLPASISSHVAVLDPLVVKICPVVPEVVVIS